LKILISNDDGIFAPGLVALASRLSQDPALEIYVSAPDRQRSATGHSLTLHKPLRVEQVTLPGKVKKAWSTTGTPSDCVKLAISQLLDEPPDLVISGINAGPNLGSDVLYSGTVAAAMEAAAANFRSIAVSAQKSGPANFERAAEFIYNFLPHAEHFHVRPPSQAALNGSLTTRRLININVPAAEKHPRIKGVTLAKLGLRVYKDVFEKRHDPNGRDYYWLSGSAIEDNEDPDSDVHLVNQGYITVTPVTFNMTDIESLSHLQSNFDFGDLQKALEAK
jgi:5'-nucleotidase